MQELQNQRWLAQQRDDDKRKREKARLQKQKDQRIFDMQQRMVRLCVRVCVMGKR